MPRERVPDERLWCERVIAVEDGGMGRVRHRHHVEAPAERLFDLASRAERIPEWDPLFVDVRDVSGPLDHAGTHFAATLKIAGVSLPVKIEVTRAERPQLLILSGTAPGGGRLCWTWRFEPRGTGADTDAELEYRLPGGIAGGIADRLLVHELIAQDIELALENLTAIAEAIERIDESTGVHPEHDRQPSIAARPRTGETLP